MPSSLIFLTIGTLAGAPSADLMRDCTEGDIARTIAGCSKIIAEHPVDAFRAVAFANRAHAYLELGESRKAIADLDSSIATDPNWAFSYRERGSAHARQGAYAEAREDIDKSLILDPVDTATLYISCQLWMQSVHYDRAINDCSKLVEQDPRTVKGYAYRGQSYLLNGEAQKAADDFLTAILLDRSNPNIYSMLGLSYSRLKDDPSALNAFTNALAIDPQMLEPLVMRAKINHEKGEKEQAESDYRTALSSPANDEYGRRLQKEAVDGLTALQVGNSSEGASRPTPKDPTETKSTACKFADEDLRKTLKCDDNEKR